MGFYLFINEIKFLLITIWSAGGCINAYFETLAEKTEQACPWIYCHLVVICKHSIAKEQAAKNEQGFFSFFFKQLFKERDYTIRILMTAVSGLLCSTEPYI